MRKDEAELLKADARLEQAQEGLIEYSRRHPSQWCRVAGLLDEIASEQERYPAASNHKTALTLMIALAQYGLHMITTKAIGRDV